jgi:hypothetical protein
VRVRVPPLAPTSTQKGEWMSIKESDLIIGHVYDHGRIVTDIFGDTVFYRFYYDGDRPNNSTPWFSITHHCKKATFKRWAYQDTTNDSNPDNIKRAMETPSSTDSKGKVDKSQEILALIYNFMSNLRSITEGE